MSGKRETYIALIRGINVSGTNKLPMKQLLAIAEEQGLLRGRTYIQSGNLVFDYAGSLPGDFASGFSAAIEVACGFRPPVLAFHADAWRDVIDHCPFLREADEAPKSVQVFMLAEEPSAEALADLSARDFGADKWMLRGRAVYLHLPNGLGRSKLATSIERILKVPMTGRNWSTMLALEELIEN